jgi:hypothetical protein
MEDKMKWFVAAGLVAFVGGAVWQFVNETAKAAGRSQRKRQPWEGV